jgi:hypothetical protein
MMRRIVLASPGGWEAPSARYRLGPLARDGPWPIEIVSAGSFPRPDQIDAVVERGGDGAALVLHRVLPSANDLARLRGRYQRLIFDFDDAIYAVPPDLARSWIRKLPRRAARLAFRGSPHASARRRPLWRTLRSVDVCVAGNAILANFARGCCQRVVEIPTTVHPVSTPPASRPNPPVLVWIGLPDNLQHLTLLREPLRQLGREIDFRLRIISSRTWEDAPLEPEFVPWSLEAASQGLMTSSVGLAPLIDDPWTRGKCAFRSIQYGGHGLPAVASPVGITERVVLHGKTGFIARRDQEWLEAIRALLRNPALVDAMGLAALAHIRRSYSDAVSLGAWKDVLASL